MVRVPWSGLSQSFWGPPLSLDAYAVLSAESCPCPLCCIDLHHICCPIWGQIRKENELPTASAGFSWMLCLALLSPPPKWYEQANEPPLFSCQYKRPNSGHRTAAHQMMVSEMWPDATKPQRSLRMSFPLLCSWFSSAYSNPYRNKECLCLGF